MLFLNTNFESVFDKIEELQPNPSIFTWKIISSLPAAKPILEIKLIQLIVDSYEEANYLLYPNQLVTIRVSVL